MKKISILISVVVVIVLVLSCAKTETTPQFAQSTATFTVTPSATSVAVALKDSTSAALTFTWTDPKFSSGLAQTKFTVYACKSGTDFSSFLTKSFTGELSGTLLGKEINSMALRFGGTVGQPVDLDVKVVASLINNNQVLSSAATKITVTPYGDLTLKSSSKSVVCTAATSGQVGDTLSWTSAFVGYNGHVTYQLQYAKGGTSFASPVSDAVTSFSKIFTKLDLNKAAGAVGIAPGATANVDFRIKATNDQSQVLYSNTSTISISTYVAYNSIGIIGDATAGGWNVDTDMYRPDPINNPSAWTLNVYLTGGLSVKFRADDDWTNNWGAASFPSGTGLSGGANIPVSNSGYYQVNFNAGTGAYSFTALTTTTYTNVSVIGDATPGGWGADTQLTQGTDPNVWTGTVAMTSGGAFKFRANNAWSTNWGPGYSSPKGSSGWGVQDGANISVTKSTNYFVYINTATGEFFFGDVTNNPGAGTPYNQIGIIGDATPNGWGGDTQMIQNPANKYKWSLKVTLTGPGQYAKFRANSDWTVNWGDSGFANGIGTQGGANIPVNAGKAQVTFNSATGEYSFSY